MENLLINLVGTTRTETLNGQQYLVAPMTMIVEGVLPGSKGPLYYPQEELKGSVDQWNGLPIVINHPYDSNNNPISARNPDVFNKQVIGTVFNATFNQGKLKADLTVIMSNRPLKIKNTTAGDTLEMIIEPAAHIPKRNRRPSQNRHAGRSVP